ncbi:MAG: glucose-1-phosphate adenylyltransferase subunit GlgD [Ruminococcus sp.]|nr:glucose-1-phosphate adenylyltransferase subunit GlgD [Ruminococcus sp.]
MGLNMGNVLGLVFANMHDVTVSDLTKNRTMGSILFGGRYRLIDFTLSNMVNSGINEVGVITKSNYQSLLDHIGSAREWDLSRKKGGLHILPPFGNTHSVLYRGRLEALYGALSFIKASLCEYVVLSDCDLVTNMDFKPIVRQHVESGADITMVTTTGMFNADQTGKGTVVSVGEDNRVHDVLIRCPISGNCTMNLNIFVLRKDFLIDLIQNSVARGMYSFEESVLQARVKELKIVAYDYKKFYRKIDSLNSYYQANLDLIDVENSKQLFLPKRPIYTKVRDNGASKYGLESNVTNSLIADGCIIEGKVENCVLFRGVKIGKGTKVRNSILMQDTVIGNDCEINYVITDKNVNICNNRLLTSTAAYPMYIGKGASI